MVISPAFEPLLPPIPALYRDSAVAMSLPIVASSVDWANILKSAPSLTVIPLLAFSVAPLPNIKQTVSVTVIRSEISTSSRT
ncbi:MAG: hypothetical protein MJZ05_13680 [Fibrobacter sp.]|nr:hypothetical protein [Fibrobacter sp.]